MKTFRTSTTIAILTTLVALAMPAIAQQPLILKVLETKQIPAGETNTQLVSVAEASDGNTYSIECILGAGRRFLLGAALAGQASAGYATPTVIGCNVPPGIYTARWDKGHLKVHHEENGKSKETAFAVLSSAPTKR